MAAQLHVNGEALIKVNAALDTLGVSVDGVDIAIENHAEPVYPATYGPRMPFDEQYFGETARISFTLIFYDEAVLAPLRAISDNTTEGQIGTPGSLYGANSIYKRLLITSPVASRPYNFLKARPVDAQRGRVGTRRTTWDMTWFAIPYSGSAGDPDGTVLYNSTTS